MINFKKIVYFILGLFVVPPAVGLPFLSFGAKTYEDSISFFGGVYFFIYLFFPLLYRKKIQNLIPNRYRFYVILYFPFILLFLLAKIMELSYLLHN